MKPWAAFSRSCLGGVVKPYETRLRNEQEMSEHKEANTCNSFQKLPVKSDKVILGREGIAEELY